MLNFTVKVDFSKHIYTFRKSIHYDLLGWSLLQKYGIQIVSVFYCFFSSFFEPLFLICNFVVIAHESKWDSVEYDTF